MLDVSVQAQIIDLLVELQHELGIAYVLVSHELAVVSRVAHQIVVLRQGKTVEQGAASDIFERSAAACTRELIYAIPDQCLDSRQSA